MARSISSLPNTIAPDSDFPDGRFKDKVGTNPGTRLNEAMLGDISQFFAKIMREANITYNDLADSEYNGLQLYQALLGVFGGMRRTTYPIGVWNMNTDAFTSVLTAIDIEKVRGATFVIVDDAGTNVYVNGANVSTGDTDATLGITSTGFALGRKTGGVFDSSSFQSTSVNRGYIILDTYEL